MRLRNIQHDPEKWIPVFRKDHAQRNIQHDPEKWQRFSEKIMRHSSARLNAGTVCSLDCRRGASK
jgi:hypothetical protein